MHKVISCLIFFQQIFVRLIDFTCHMAVNLQFIINHITAIQQFHLRVCLQCLIQTDIFRPGLFSCIMIIKCLLLQINHSMVINRQKSIQPAAMVIVPVGNNNRIHLR